jgi:hypothetical protein
VKLWDTSALLSLLVKQAATRELKALLAADDGLALWWGTKVEAVSAVCRLRRGGELEEAFAPRLIRQVNAIVSAAYEVQPTEEVRTAACRALRVHDLRAADALQLAAALVWTEHSPAGMGFVCLDQQLREAAAREGFEVFPR